MPIGTPVEIGTAFNASAVTSAAITVPAGGVPTGAQIVVALTVREQATSIGITDDSAAGTNTYVEDMNDPSNAVGNVQVSLFRVSKAFELLENDIITIAWTNISEVGAASGYVTGVQIASPIDQQAQGEGSTTGDDDPAIDTGNITTTVPASVVFGVVGYDAANPRTIIEDASFTVLSNQGGASGRQAHLAYRVSTVAETVNYAPTGFDGAGDDWAAFIINYKAPGIAAALYHQRHHNRAA